MSLWSVYGLELMPRPQIKKYNREIRVPAEPDNSENIVESVLDFGDRFLRDEVPD